MRDVSKRSHAGFSLEAVGNNQLAVILSYQEELARQVVGEEISYWIRLYLVPTVIGECGRSIRSCPDVDLYIATFYGDSGEEPTLFRLPSAKGWEFIRWVSDCPSVSNEPMSGFVVRTALPGANIDADELDEWRPTEYEVCVSPASASFSAKIRDAVR